LTKKKLRNIGIIDNERNNVVFKSLLNFGNGLKNLKFKMNKKAISGANIILQRAPSITAITPKKKIMILKVFFSLANFISPKPNVTRDKRVASLQSCKQNRRPTINKV
jgi:hypothetical protein